LWDIIFATFVEMKNDRHFELLIYRNFICRGLYLKILVFAHILNREGVILRSET